MKNYFKYIFVLLFLCLFSLQSNAFPKKKHSIIKDKIDREKFEKVQESGYYLGYLDYCSYGGTGEQKNTYKRVKGLVAYTNWDLFLVFNKGYQDVHNTLVVAGVGWGGNQWGQNTNWTQHQINWKYNLDDGCPTGTLIRVISNLDDLIQNVLIKFMKSRDNYESNFTQLISALENDKKNDYSGVIQRLKIVSDPNYQGETITTEDEPIILEDNSSGDSSDDIVTQLKKLKALFEDDLISEDEYNAKKKELLDQM